jgi:hypothetical protein
VINKKEPNNKNRIAQNVSLSITQILSVFQQMQS